MNVLRTVNDATRYGFAVGRVMALRARVFTKPTFERLLDAPTFEEQRRILSDTHYGRYLEDARTTDEVERALDTALDDFYGFLGTSQLPEPVTRFFRVRYDYRNLRAMLQAELLEVPLEGMLTHGLGTLPAEAFEPGKADRLPEELRAAHSRVAAISGDGPSPEEIGRLVDQEMFADLLATARRARSRYLQGLARLMIDLANLRALVRSRLRGAPPREAALQLVAGGSLPPKRLLALYDAPLEELASQAARHEALRGVDTSELSDPSRLDVIADNVVVDYVHRAHTANIGPEPVIAYVMAREAEVSTLKLLLMGRIAGIPSHSLRERMREAYY